MDWIKASFYGEALWVKVEREEADFVYGMIDNYPVSVTANTAHDLFYGERVKVPVDKVLDRKDSAEFKEMLKCQTT